MAEGMGRIHGLQGAGQSLEVLSSGKLSDVDRRVNGIAMRVIGYAELAKVKALAAMGITYIKLDAGDGGAVYAKINDVADSLGITGREVKRDFGGEGGLSKLAERIALNQGIRTDEPSRGHVDLSDRAAVIRMGSVSSDEEDELPSRESIRGGVVSGDREMTLDFVPKDIKPADKNFVNQEFTKIVEKGVKSDFLFKDAEGKTYRMIVDPKTLEVNVIKHKSGMKSQSNDGSEGEKLHKLDRKATFGKGKETKEVFHGFRREAEEERREGYKKAEGSKTKDNMAFESAVDALGNKLYDVDVGQGADTQLIAESLPFALEKELASRAKDALEKGRTDELLAQAIDVAQGKTSQPIDVKEFGLALCKQVGIDSPESMNKDNFRGILQTVYGKEVGEFIERMVSSDPEKRPSVAEVGRILGESEVPDGKVPKG